MLVEFFFRLRKALVPVSITEFLTLMRALDRRVASQNVDDFYHLSRACLVKDERHYDRFDRAFGAHFEGIEELFEDLEMDIPLEWLRLEAEKLLSEEEKRQIESLGGWEALMETLRKRLEGAKRTSSRWFEVDRHRWHVAVWRVRL